MNLNTPGKAFPAATPTPVPTIDTVHIGVVGLGYVGLPIAVHMAQKFPVTGFDISEQRIEELRGGVDRTREITPDELGRLQTLKLTSDRDELGECNFYIVTVPTPVDQAKRPDLTALERASAAVGKVLKRGDVAVFESTVYPGATEEVCVPILEAQSGLKLNQDFSVGYSPERINPGDPNHRLPNIVKITSGSNGAAAALINAVYGRIVTAGTHPVSSIRVAEAAKVIENIQRDVNIALINELAMLFKHLDLETREVLEAAGTKWNFHGYRPGLVGGHCIGVDPYYLTYKAQSVGFHPDMILAGRRINDTMPQFIAHDIIRCMSQRNQRIANARVLVMGFTFKENCADVRNSKVADLVKQLKAFAIHVDIYDPLAIPAEAMHEHGTEISNTMPEGPFDAIVLAVAHDEIRKAAASGLSSILAPRGLIYDIKSILPRDGDHHRI